MRSSFGTQKSQIEKRTARTLLAFLLLALNLSFSPYVQAGSWEYKAPFRYVPDNGTQISAPPGASIQLFNRNAGPPPLPYIPPAQPQQSSGSSWLPMAMIGLTVLPMLFKDQPSGQPSGQTNAKYQLAKDSPTHSKTVRRTPASIPLRKRYVQVQDSYSATGAK